MESWRWGVIAFAAAALAASCGAQALTGGAVTDSLWRVQVGTTTQMRVSGQVIGYPTPAWQLTVPHASGSYGDSTAQFGIREQYAVEERLVLTPGISGSIGLNETLLTWTASRAVAFDLMLAASVVQQGTATGADGLVELDVGDDGTVELTASLGDVRQLRIPMSMTPGTLVVRTRTRVQGTGADPTRPAELVANATVIAMFTAASWTPLGAGCAGSNGTPMLAPLGGQRPWAGEPFTVELTNLPGGAVFGMLGLSRSTWGAVQLPLPLGFIGMPGCVLYNDIQGVFGLTALSSTVNWLLMIPADVGLVGNRFYQQALVLDQGVNALGATVSNSGSATIGSRNQ